MINSVDCLIIGRGVAGAVILDYLVAAQIPLEGIAWIGPLDKESTCSFNSTALVAKQGVQKGLSELGDILSESFEITENFIKRENPHGVETAQRFHFYRDDIEREKLINRFGDCFEQSPFGLLGISEMVYLINPIEYLEYLSKKNTSSLKYNEDAFVINVTRKEDYWLVKTGATEYKAKQVIDCTGAYGQFIHCHSLRPPAKIVSGHYIEWNNIHFEKSMVLTYGGHNLIYRSSDKTLLLSGTAVKDGTMVPRSEILNIYEEMRDQFHNIVPKTMGRVKIGAREKARKRLPYLREVNKGFFSIGGYYKNGYTFSHYIAHKLVRKL